MRISIFFGIATLAVGLTLGAETPTSVPPPNDVSGQLAKSVEKLENTVGDLETLNSNWRFWIGVAVFMCTGLVTVISDVSVFAKDPWSTGLKIATASLSAIATVLALLPNTFHWESEQRKYGAAFAELSAIEWDLRINAKPMTEIITSYDHVVRLVHEPGSIETISTMPSPTSTP